MSHIQVQTINVTPPKGWLSVIDRIISSTSSKRNSASGLKLPYPQKVSYKCSVKLNNLYEVIAWFLLFWIQSLLFRDDTIVDWWLALYTCTQLWYSNNMEEAAKLYKEIEDFPEMYQVRPFLVGIGCINFKIK